MVAREVATNRVEHTATSAVVIVLDIGGGPSWGGADGVRFLLTCVISPFEVLFDLKS